MGKIEAYEEDNTKNRGRLLILWVALDGFRGSRSILDAIGIVLVGYCLKRMNMDSLRIKCHVSLNMLKGFALPEQVKPPFVIPFYFYVSMFV